MSFVLLLVLSVIWGGLVTVAAAGIQRLGLSGRTRQMMWRCTSIMLLVPFPVALVYALSGPGVIEPVWNYGEGEAPSIPVVLDEMPVMAQPVVREASQGLPFEFDLAASAIAFLALGWMFRAFRARWASKELEVITSKSEPVYSHAILSSADFWNERLGLHRKTEFRLLPGDYSPFTQGVFKPIVYLPNGLERQLSREEMALVVGHELMHVSRLDAVWRPIERIVADILWFNPFAWLVRMELDRAREIACDEAMLVSEAPPTVYARALVAAARFAEGLPTRAPAAAMFPFNKDKELTERVKIAVANSQGNSSLVGLAAFGLFLAAGLPLAAAQGAGAEKVRAPIPDFTATVIESGQAKLSSAYGKRKDPFTKKSAWHSGVDIAVKLGTEIHVPAKGLVVFVGTKDGYGNAIEIKHNEEWLTRYGQLDEILVEEGQSVQAGDVIATVGKSGRATGPHLHLEVHGPKSDYNISRELGTYDPERMGVALIPALELRAKQIRELGVVLPKEEKTQKIMDRVAPIAPPNPPIPPKVTGITYMDDGRVQVLKAGIAYIEFNPMAGDLTPNLIKGVGKKKYSYHEVNGDYVKFIAGSSDVPDQKLGIWVKGNKIETSEDWIDWRKEMAEAARLATLRDVDEQQEREELAELSSGRVELKLERRIEEKAAIAERRIESWADNLERRIESEARAFERNLEKSQESMRHKQEAKAHAQAFAQAQMASSQAFAQNWTWAGQQQAAKAQIVALEQTLKELDAEVLSLSQQCDAAEKKTGLESKSELKGLQMAKSAVENARTQIAEQLADARKTLKSKRYASSN